MLALASVATRPVFWHFVVWLKVVWYVLAVTSVVVFAYGVARPLVKYRHGHGGGLPPARAAARAAVAGTPRSCSRTRRSAGATRPPGGRIARSSTGSSSCSRAR